MTDPIEIITTGDGSHSLLNKTLNETYHSVHGALRESQHVFIANGLNYLLDKFKRSQISIFEVGFGTGLNALLALTSVPESIIVNYTSVEAFPLPESIWTNLNYTQSDIDKKPFQQLHQSDWNSNVEMSRTFTLRKINGSLQSTELTPSSVDLIFFDAFAPSKQPEMWERPILESMYSCMRPNSVFVTYCAKGQLKRDLKSIGFTVETLPGPPGKKEMVRGLKI